MRPIYRTIDRLSDIALAMSGMVATYIVVHILVEVTARSVFSASTFVLDEFVGYSVAATTCLAAGATFRDGNFIRITFLTDLLERRARLRAALEVWCSTAALTVVVLLVWYFVAATLNDHRRGLLSDTISEFPLWIPKSLVSFGLVVLALQMSSHLVRMAVALFSPRAAIADKNDRAHDSGAAV